MMILPEKKIGFVHIYKTGGTSLTKLLMPYTDPSFRDANPRTAGSGFQGTWHYRGTQHSKFSQKDSGFPAPLRDEIDQWRFISVVRNPYTWCHSVYMEFWAHDRGQNRGPNFLFGQVDPKRSLKGFYRFSKAFLPGHPNMYGIATQSSFLKGIPQKQLRLIRFENYDEDLRQVLEEIDIPVTQIPHVLDRGQAKRDRARTLMSDPDHIAFCNSYYAEDFRRFGYEVITTPNAEPATQP